MAMVTIDNAAATIAAAEKPQDAEKPDYAPYNGTSSAADGGTGAGVRGGGGGGRVVDSVVARWRREDMLDKSPLALHGAAAVFALVALVYRCPNSAGRPFGPWHGTNLARSKHGPARSVTGPGRHGPFSGPGMGTYGGPRALARSGPINGSARRRPAYLCKY
jgi:hypothetical protein